MKEKTRGQLAVMGGCCIHLMIGSFYLWGTISTFMVSYFRKEGNPDLTMAQANILFPVTSVMNCLFNNVGLWLSAKYGSRRATLICSLLNSLLVLVSSFCTNFWLFFFIYGVGQGIMAGCLYLTPIRIAVRYFPENKGLVSGFIMGSYGCATLIISFLVIFIINPHNVSGIHFKEQDYYYYPDSVTDNVPKALQYLSLYFFFLSILGSAFMKNQKEMPNFINAKGSRRYLDSLAFDPDELKAKQNIISQIENQTDENDNILIEKSTIQINQQQNINDINTKLLIQKQQTNNPIYQLNSVSEAFKTKEIYILFTMIYFSVLYGYFMASSYKDYGYQKINDDQYLSLVVGNLASLSNGFSRLLFGAMLDKFGFRKMYFFLLSLEIFILFTIDHISSNKTSYAIWVVLSLACEGGHFVLFPSKTIEIYGLKLGAQIYSLVYAAFCCANLTQTFLIGFIKTKMKYQNIFYIFIVLTSISFILNIIFPLSTQTKSKQKQDIKIDKISINKSINSQNEITQNPIKQL